MFLAKHKQEDKFYAVKVLTKAAIRKRNEVQKCFRLHCLFYWFASNYITGGSSFSVWCQMILLLKGEPLGGKGLVLFTAVNSFLGQTHHGWAKRFTKESFTSIFGGRFLHFLYIYLGLLINQHANLFSCKSCSQSRHPIVNSNHELCFNFSQGLHYSFQTHDKLYFVLDYVNGGEVGIVRI